jgi:hypothetical protein
VTYCGAAGTDMKYMLECEARPLSSSKFTKPWNRRLSLETRPDDSSGHMYPMSKSPLWTTSEECERGRKEKKLKEDLHRSVPPSEIAFLD